MHRSCAWKHSPKVVIRDTRGQDVGLTLARVCPALPPLPSLPRSLTIPHTTHNAYQLWDRFSVTDSGFKLKRLAPRIEDEEKSAANQQLAKSMAFAKVALSHAAAQFTTLTHRVQARNSPRRLLRAARHRQQTKPPFSLSLNSAAICCPSGCSQWLLSVAFPVANGTCVRQRRQRRRRQQLRDASYARPARPGPLLTNSCRSTRHTAFSIVKL